MSGEAPPPISMQMCPSWPKEHDWKSCKRRTPFQGFKSLHLRQKTIPRLCGGLFFNTIRDLNSPNAKR